MELIFLGTPTFAVPTLERIVEAGHRVLGGVHAARSAQGTRRPVERIRR